MHPLTRTEGRSGVTVSAGCSRPICRSTWTEVRVQNLHPLTRPEGRCGPKCQQAVRGLLAGPLNSGHSGCRRNPATTGRRQAFQGGSSERVRLNRPSESRIHARKLLAGLGCLHCGRSRRGPQAASDGIPSCGFRGLSAPDARRRWRPGFPGDCGRFASAPAPVNLWFPFSPITAVLPSLFLFPSPS